jgi:hypothetical protein
MPTCDTCGKDFSQKRYTIQLARKNPCKAPVEKAVQEKQENLKKYRKEPVLRTFLFDAYFHLKLIQFVVNGEFA